MEMPCLKIMRSWEWGDGMSMQEVGLSPSVQFPRLGIRLWRENDALIVLALQGCYWHWNEFDLHLLWEVVGHHFPYKWVQIVGFWIKASLVRREQKEFRFRNWVPLPVTTSLSPSHPQAIFFGGIDVSIRGEVWPFLLHYYSFESTSEEREALRARKREEYFEIQQKR